jgi:hypothetical protein
MEPFDWMGFGPWDLSGQGTKRLIGTVCEMTSVMSREKFPPFPRLFFMEIVFLFHQLRQRGRSRPHDEVAGSTDDGDSQDPRPSWS